MEAKQEEQTGGPAQPTKSQQIQDQYQQLCTRVGDLYLKLELLKDEHVRIQKEYLKAVAEESKKS